MPAVDLWLIDVSDAAAADEALLDPAERERAATLVSPGLRVRFVRRRAALRRVLAQHTGEEPDRVRILRDCARCGDPAHGRPRLAADGPAFSASSAGDLAVVAVTAAGAIGVDVARRDALDRILAGELPRELLSAAEAAALAAAPDRAAFLRRLWVRKEALGKLAGTGLGARPATLDTLGGGHGPVLTDLAPAPGYRGALAVSGGAVSVTVRFG
jgi:4'-phosphopantetheinyl transferase